tara:strand:+ start:200 stop:418 length:219 start_codon:yes stop_codon:yes gene_type:complete
VFLENLDLHLILHHLVQTHKLIHKKKYLFLLLLLHLHLLQLKNLEHLDLVLNLHHLDFLEKDLQKVCFLLHL